MKSSNFFRISGEITSVTILELESSSVAKVTLRIQRDEHKCNVALSKIALLNMEVWSKKENIDTKYRYLQEGNHVTMDGFFRPNDWIDQDNNHHYNFVLNVTKIQLQDENRQQRPEQKVGEIG